jgi:steroid delta-isomerase-like uncharacterized protein
MTPTPTPEVAAQLIRDLVDAWNAHDADRLAALYAPDFEEDDVAQARAQHGPESVRALMRLYLRAFPDVQILPERVIIQGDQIAFAWTLCGTHRGTLMNIPPTGRGVRIRGVSLITVAQGRIQRATRIWDMAGMLRAFGLLPEL